MDARDFIKIGMSAERMLVVPPERTVGHFVPGMPMVYATPMMILDMEMASGDAIRARVAARLGHGRDRGRYPPSCGGACRCHGADHRESGRGRAPRDPLRGRGFRGHAQARRRPPCPRPDQCREFQQAAGRDFGAVNPRKYTGERASYFANSFERFVAAAMARVISGWRPSLRHQHLQRRGRGAAG